MMSDQDILLPNGFVAIPANATATFDVSPSVATLLSNLARYGYTLDRLALAALANVPDHDLDTWWTTLRRALMAMTAEDRQMENHVVYRNFPREVLDMDVADQVVRQIMIYLGVPYDHVREPIASRPPLGDMTKLKVLSLADDATLTKIFTDLMVMPHAWSDNQLRWASKLVGTRNGIVFSDFGFKVNAVKLAAQNFASMEFEVTSGTDVLRLCAELSGNDPTLRVIGKLHRFSRPQRRRLLAALNGQRNLADDMAMRPELWKRLMHRLHPGDFKEFHAVSTAYDGLYNKRIKSFAALVDPQAPTLATLDTLVQRPGEFLRRFHRYYALFGSATVQAFIPVMAQLTPRQLVGFRAYLRTIGSRKTLIYAPRSNWFRAKVQPNTKCPIDPEHRRLLEMRISEILSSRLAHAFPEGVALDDLATDQIKLQTNDQRLAEYGRGTRFAIPANITFVRSASYWANPRNGGVTWFDNGWNFFDENWKPQGVVAWNEQNFGNAAIMSGDPVNIRDLDGRGCQMIDLYLDNLWKQGVRYAVWSILCFSNVKFSAATEVLATLQMGEHAESGNTYEPARAQMVFPIKSDALTNYIAYIDLAKRTVVYMDAGLKGNVESAEYNGTTLQQLMPAYVEYLESIPTVLELMQDAPAGTMPVLYDDVHTSITEGRAFVFRPENKANSYQHVSVTDLTMLE